jgi:hypothetical protein
MSKRKILTVITDALGDRVVVGETELLHSIEKHFVNVPTTMVLELIEMVLKDPTEIFRDDSKKERIFNFFYKLESRSRFVVVAVKVTKDGAYFASAYPTGSKPRNAHKKLKGIKS